MRLTLKLGAAALLAAGAGLAFTRRAPEAPPLLVSPRAVQAAAQPDAPSLYWNAGTIYFLLTDRFLNGDTTNDHALGRAHDGAVMRSFEGGDLAGVLRKINEGWFDSLGVSAIWLSPFVEQIHGSVDEGQGKTYGYHGYWTRDWTALDPAFGTPADLHAVVDAAHRHGIRVIMDAVINHTGPTTPDDPAWPADWVRTGPQCTFRSYVTTTACTLVPTLPDVLTERDDSVGLPPALIATWRAEGRLDHELSSLDDFFHRTGYPRAPKYYIIKWLTDWVRDYGIDGYRVDTAKHFGEAVSAALRHEADIAYADWRHGHPRLAPDSLPFYMVGEVYGYSIGSGREYDFGDRTVDYFANGYDALINFSFKSDATHASDSVFQGYAAQLHGPLAGEAVLNYLSSHDDGAPYDLHRTNPIGAATRLLLAPGGAQIYYGDETARPLVVPGAQGDANLRGLMNWSDVASDTTTQNVLRYWRRLGQFRHAHPAIGAGTHQTLQAQPFVFSRALDAGTVHDRVVVALGEPAGFKTIPTADAFANGAPVQDAFSGEGSTVTNGHVSLTTPFDVVLLAARSSGRARHNPHDPVRVEVVNDYSTTLDVYAVGGGTSYRLGAVAAGMDGHFQLRAASVMGNGQVEFLVQQQGPGRAISVGAVFVHPGDVVDVTIATQILGSSAVVRP